MTVKQKQKQQHQSSPSPPVRDEPSGSSLILQYRTMMCEDISEHLDTFPIMHKLVYRNQVCIRPIIYHYRRCTFVFTASIVRAYFTAKPKITVYGMEITAQKFSSVKKTNLRVEFHDILIVILIVILAVCSKHINTKNTALRATKAL